MVAGDYLVSFQANRYSVPYRLIGKTVEVILVGELIRIEHAGQLVAEHPRLTGKHQMRILPQHGPGPAARNARQRYGQGDAVLLNRWVGPDEVEVRDLTVYEELAA
jgi:hypothetical protein